MANCFNAADNRTLFTPNRVNDDRGWRCPKKEIHLKPHSISLSETSKPTPTDDYALKHQHVAAMKKVAKNPSNSGVNLNQKRECIKVQQLFSPIHSKITHRISQKSNK